jgi:hypothetical protein
VIISIGMGVVAKYAGSANNDFKSMDEIPIFLIVKRICEP